MFMFPPQTRSCIQAICWFQSIFFLPDADWQAVPSLLPSAISRCSTVKRSITGPRGGFGRRQSLQSVYHLLVQGQQIPMVRLCQVSACATCWLDSDQRQPTTAATPASYWTSGRRAPFPSKDPESRFLPLSPNSCSLAGHKSDNVSSRHIPALSRYDKGRE
ncbi:hypothetical protein CONLIGDRAFT_436368 [Coniochaeta ligniaria NRRL 30616]|uniref:Uncharacterized protein n=1 Tax=Coniochaeta ligniaria NRRL 30616 TaxID=1408157 RepID=A0A1J7IJR7_9PEZI|nr:hypothetical protein CONLIGDRAFT_436368 [Coniochaeta ligniaria NRRL 30616]